MDTDFARQQMVDQQVRAWDVLHPDVLAVLRNVPREQFVPRGYEDLAFADTEIPIGFGQSMMTPTLEGRVLQALKPTADDSVLEVGTGTGFLAACLGRLADEVVSIDIHGDFLPTAQVNLEDSGIGNVELLEMDATAELPDRLFDVVAVTGSIPEFDPRFVFALKPQGRLFVVIGEGPAMEARRVVRTGETDWTSESLFETRLKALEHVRHRERFLF